MRIESGTTSERRIRITIFFVMTVAMSLWFGLDGFWRYSRKNLDWAQQQMPVKPEDPWVNPQATVETLRQITRGMTAQEVEGLVGEPILVEQDDNPEAEKRILWFVGPAAYTKVTFEEEKVSTELLTTFALMFKDELDRADLSENFRRQFGNRAQRLSEKTAVTVAERGARWRIDDGERGYLVLNEDGKLKTYVAGPEVRENEQRSESDIQLQKIIGAILAAVSLVVAVKVYFVSRTRVVLDDGGLTLNRRHVPWDAMTGLATDDYDRKGWVDLEYGSNEATRSLRIDSYHIERFDEIVSAICERKQFPSPIGPGDAEDDADLDEHTD